MAAGAVSAPLIIPMIQPQTNRVKNHIDTSTPVCLQSDTPGVQIFYTLDGSRPAASSRSYREPVLLPAGRVSVRALAETSDGRQSSVVTKVFSVDQAGTGTDPEVLQDTRQPPSEGMSCPAENSAASLRPAEPRMMGNCPQSGLPLCQLGSGTQLEGSGDLSGTPASRLQRQTDFLRCLQCLVLRPLDPLARFCPRCGAVVPPVPVQRLPPAEGGQMLLCVFCNSLVPVNTENCLICGAPIDEQRLEGHVLCVCCGSGNPAHLSSCLTCETHLQQAGVGSSAPSVPSAGGRWASCSRCQRMNHSDARYCDWCGSKCGHAVSCVVCWCCGANGDPNASYCGSCGVFLESPAPPTTYSDVTPPVGGRATGQATPSSDPAPSVKLALPTVDRSTQTVGLYYPSATELHRKQQQRAEPLSQDPRPPLTAVSPGRGYWRKQLDHVCAHLRSYAQNHAPFRALLGEPRLGRVVSAMVQEDQYEVSLTVSFVSAGRETKPVSPEEDGAGPSGGGIGPVVRAESLSSVTERSIDGLSVTPAGGRGTLPVRQRWTWR
ncbi:double zinc ribbon and ankyrin repeat-containing protein 1-like isoform X2 [Acanthochromis polyacanthus]|uniref:double zinc ribbon and ankyrin repeat-containing protein 1 isoform X2 n=1 Tax=Acanthochromis polyacanthus TaxID=80966 RepID=UPI00223488AF|nr:double zinc ribbon and ankyrin repeat-containing protein 1 isoform X2 [Acanthochromis polyacanthus]XP_051802040.1 double zinc ribbon and ankyrin repeat-containing protein 1-like isoform X2 [Acanthochromis polyacanthus]